MDDNNTVHKARLDVSIPKSKPPINIYAITHIIPIPKKFQIACIGRPKKEKKIKINNPVI